MVEVESCLESTTSVATNAYYWVASVASSYGLRHQELLSYGLVAEV